MKLCRTQNEAITLAGKGHTTLWIRDERKETKGLEEVEDDFRTGYIYSVDENILKMIARVIAPDVLEEPTIERPFQRQLPEEVLALMDDDFREAERLRNSTPCHIKVCGAPLDNCSDFIEGV